MRKSVKMQQIKDGAILMKMEGDRFHKVYYASEYDYGDIEEKIYVYICGYDDLGEDWRAEYETLEELRNEMGDLRRWSQTPWL